MVTMFLGYCADVAMVSLYGGINHIDIGFCCVPCFFFEFVWELNEIEDLLFMEVLYLTTR